jgi:hypothetical protein
MTTTSEREPTPYERAGIAWWNGLSHTDRARWFKIANTCIVAEAYACYLALLEAFDGDNDDDPLVHPFFGTEWRIGLQS